MTYSALLYSLKIVKILSNKKYGGPANNNNDLREKMEMVKHFFLYLINRVGR